MNYANQLANVFQNNRRLFLLTTGSKLRGDQGVLQPSFTGHTDCLTVHERTLATTSSEFLVQNRIVDDGNFRDLFNQQGNRNAGMRETVNEVHGTIHRVDDPGWGIRQLGLLPGAGLFLTDKPEVTLEALAKIVLMN